MKKYFLLLVVHLSLANNLAQLKNYYENHHFKFYKDEYFFTCHPYGIRTLSEMHAKLDLDKTCKDELVEFRKNDPIEKYFGTYVLDLEQLYHLEAVEAECIIYLNAGKTYNELLLEKGYAYLKNEEFKYKRLQRKFKEANEKAKKFKRGMYGYEKLVKCLK